MIWIQIGKDNFIIVQINIKFKIEIWKKKKKKNQVEYVTITK